MIPACNNGTGIPKAATVLLAAALLFTGTFMWSGAAPVEVYDGKLSEVDVSRRYVVGKWLPKKGQAVAFYR